MEKLHHMKKMLICCVENQMSHLETVDTKELGEAIDMIKDLSEAIYYCTITKAMEGKEPEHRDIDRMKGRMYYDGYADDYYRSLPTDRRTGPTHHEPMPLGDIMRDHREGKSPISRKMYIESKEMHKDKTSQLQELERYAQELTADMVEMIEDASPEEKQYLSNRLTALAAKIK